MRKSVALGHVQGSQFTSKQTVVQVDEIQPALLWGTPNQNSTEGKLPEDHLQPPHDLLLTAP
jgi:hypothetical protein